MKRSGQARQYWLPVAGPNLGSPLTYGKNHSIDRLDSQMGALLVARDRYHLQDLHKQVIKPVKATSKPSGL
jgi:hypothetical protein